MWHPDALIMKDLVIEEFGEPNKTKNNFDRSVWYFVPKNEKFYLIVVGVGYIKIKYNKLSIISSFKIEDVKKICEIAKRFRHQEKEKQSQIPGNI